MCLESRLCQAHGTDGTVLAARPAAGTALRNHAGLRDGAGGKPECDRPGIAALGAYPAFDPAQRETRAGDAGREPPRLCARFTNGKRAARAALDAAPAERAGASVEADFREAVVAADDDPNRALRHALSASRALGEEARLRDSPGRPDSGSCSCRFQAEQTPSALCQSRLAVRLHNERKLTVRLARPFDHYQRAVFAAVSSRAISDFWAMHNPHRLSTLRLLERRGYSGPCVRGAGEGGSPGECGQRIGASDARSGAGEKFKLGRQARSSEHRSAPACGCDFAPRVESCLPCSARIERPIGPGEKQVSEDVQYVGPYAASWPLPAARLSAARRHNTAGHKRAAADYAAAAAMQTSLRASVRPNRHRALHCCSKRYRLCRKRACHCKGRSAPVDLPSVTAQRVVHAMETVPARFTPPWRRLRIALNCTAPSSTSGIRAPLREKVSAWHLPYWVGPAPTSNRAPTRV